MSWNYRVVHEVHEDEEIWTICEVYYEADGVTPCAYAPKTRSPMANSLDDQGTVGGWKVSLGWTLDRMREALEKPVLEAKDIAS